MRITVLGAGSWGTTLAVLLSGNGHDVTLWAFSEDDARTMDMTRENPSFLPGIRIPPSVRITADLQGSLPGTRLLVAAVPAQYLRSVMERCAGVVPQETLMVNVAKGVENGTLMTMSEVIRDVLPQTPVSRIVTLSGPSHAEEVSRNMPTTVVAASVDRAAALEVQAVFMTPTFRVYDSTDLRGVELGGALKNVIAIAAGIIDGAGLGDNTKAALMTRGIAEIARIGVAMGAHLQTFAGLSGIGDLMVTCMSTHSRNRYVGVEIGKGRKVKEILGGMVMVAEGVATAQSAHELSLKVGVETPIVTQVHRILFEGKDPLRACRDLMTRDPKGEVWGIKPQ